VRPLRNVRRGRPRRLCCVQSWRDGSARVWSAHAAAAFGAARGRGGDARVGPRAHRRRSDALRRGRQRIPLRRIGEPIPCGARLGAVRRTNRLRRRNVRGPLHRSALPQPQHAELPRRPRVPRHEDLGSDAGMGVGLRALPPGRAALPAPLLGTRDRRDRRPRAVVRRGARLAVVGAPRGRGRRNGGGRVPLHERRGGAVLRPGRALPARAIEAAVGARVPRGGGADSRDLAHRRPRDRGRRAAPQTLLDRRGVRRDTGWMRRGLAVLPLAHARRRLRNGERRLRVTVCLAAPQACRDLSRRGALGGGVRHARGAGDDGRARGVADKRAGVDAGRGDVRRVRRGRALPFLSRVLRDVGVQPGADRRSVPRRADRRAPDIPMAPLAPALDCGLLRAGRRDGRARSGDPGGKQPPAARRVARRHAAGRRVAPPSWARRVPGARASQS
jgi:hypothetical protein